MTFINQLRSVHFIELRARVIKSACMVALTFSMLIFFSGSIYDFVARPLISMLPEGASMIATEVATPFLIPIKLTIFVSFFLSLPFILYQIWSFVAPGLYLHERRLLVPIVISSVVLFYGGVAFSYYTVFPLIFSFFTSVGPAGVAIATDISSYLDFVLTLFFTFGLSFEIPIVIVLICWSGVVSPTELNDKRPYVIVGMFILGMIITPPDIFSQTLVAVPMIALWEVGIFFSRFYSIDK